MKEKIITLLQGSLMGIAEIIPGVSGSTLALILGIYDDFINLIHSVSVFAKDSVGFAIKKKTKEQLKKSFWNIDFRFGIMLVVGMTIAVALFANILSFLLDEHPQYLFAFLAGLIISSIIIPYSQMDNRSIKELAVFVVTFIIMFIVLGLGADSHTENPSYIMLLLGGIVAASAMTLPGVSGSFMLLLFGLYDAVIDMVKNLTHFDTNFTELSKLFVFGTGVLLGLGISSTIIKWAFTNYKSITIAFLIGLMLSSLRILNPFQFEADGVPQIYDAIFKTILILLGMFVVGIMYKFSSTELDKVDNQD